MFIAETVERNLSLSLTGGAVIADTMPIEGPRPRAGRPRAPGTPASTPAGGHPWSSAGPRHLDSFLYI